MMVFGHPVCFLNCHLPAHMRNLEQRMEDFESILQQQQFEGGTAVGVLDHEWVSTCEKSRCLMPSLTYVLLKLFLALFC